jgi:predicted enzyme related to lactoylglutathione lyase
MTFLGAPALIWVGLEGRMRIDALYGVMTVSDLQRARDFYEMLFGRGPDASPMAGLHEWHFGQSGVQVVKDPGRAGSAMLTIIVDQLEAVRRDIGQRGLELGNNFGGEFALVAQIEDPDGNRISFTQPGPVAFDQPGAHVEQWVGDQ